MKKIVMAALIGTVVMAGYCGTAAAFQMRAPVTAPGQPVLLAQTGDAAMRVLQLEEQIRQLNGRIEEMSFQLLQMQEQMRKAQQDNEFRFQELEKSKTGGKKSSLEGPAETPAAPKDSVADVINQTPPSGGVPPAPNNNVANNNTTTSPPANGSQTANNTAQSPRNLGSIELDSKGMPKTITPGGNGTATLPGVDTGSTAAVNPQIPTLDSEKDVYQSAYSHVLSGDYMIAEAEFRDFIQRYPKSDKIADAHFWLGEAEYSQGNFSGAAKTFLNAHQAYNTSPKAPEMLLKLGMSLAQLDNTETACATLREVSKRYPKASKPVLTKLASEQKRLSC